MEETLALEEVEGVEVMEGEADTELLPIGHGLHCINRRGWEPGGNRTPSGY